MEEKKNECDRYLVGLKLFGLIFKIIFNFFFLIFKKIVSKNGRYKHNKIILKHSYNLIVEYYNNIT